MKKSSKTAKTIEVDNLADVIKAVENRRKADLGFVSLPEVEGFDYPTFFTASFDYFATGEGMTVGIVMGYAHSAEKLTTLVNEHFGEYYAAGAEVWSKLHLPSDVAGLVPDAIRKVIADPAQVIGNFLYSSTYHLNQS